MNNTIRESERAVGTIGGLKGWVMILLTLIFVCLYAAALLGWLRPLSDVTMITRLEPIIFVIAGYYFGRLPGQSIERTLKEEIMRYAQKTDSMQHAKELAEKERDTAEERAKNARLALIAGHASPVPQMTPPNGRASSTGRAGGFESESVNIAVRILGS